MQEEIYKCKIIGDKKSKPFWATLTEVNGAIKICREFMDQYVFEEFTRHYREIFDIIDHGFGPKGCQPRCGLDGTVVTRHYDKFRKKCWQRPKLRVYNTKEEYYRSHGYYILPHLKTSPCTIKDQTGIHCREREEIARIFMDKIVSKYFANTFTHAAEVDHFYVSFAASFGKSTKYLCTANEVLMAIYDADREYRRYIKGLGRLSEILTAKLKTYGLGIGSPFTLLGPYMHSFMDPELIGVIMAKSENVGSFTISGITDKGFIYALHSDSQWGVGFNDDSKLHIFDRIIDLAKQCKKDDDKLQSVHMSFNLSGKFQPAAPIKPVITTPLRKDEFV